MLPPVLAFHANLAFKTLSDWPSIVYFGVSHGICHHIVALVFYEANCITLTTLVIGLRIQRVQYVFFD